MRCAPGQKVFSNFLSPLRVVGQDGFRVSNTTFVQVLNTIFGMIKKPFRSRKNDENCRFQQVLKTIFQRIIVNSMKRLRHNLCAIYPSVCLDDKTEVKRARRSAKILL